MKIKSIFLTLFIMMCLIFIVQNVHADPMDGTAYAVLTDEGELILFRSTETYTDGAGQTVTDIMGNTYTGQVYTGIETTNESGTGNSPWYSQKSLIKSVRVVNEQTIKPVNCCYWFYNCSACNSMDLTGLDTENVTNMYRMFSGCSGLTSLDIHSFNTDKVTDMSYMLSWCSGLTSLNLSRFNTENGGTFNVKVPDARFIGDPPVPGSHNTTNKIIGPDGKVLKVWREASGNATESEMALGTGKMWQATHTEQRALTR